MAMLNARFARALGVGQSGARRRIARYIARLPMAWLRIGAMTRHRELTALAALRARAPCCGRRLPPSPIRPSAPWERSAARSRSMIRRRIIRRLSGGVVGRPWKSPDHRARAGSPPPTIFSIGTPPRWRQEKWLLRDPSAAARGWRWRLSQARPRRWRFCDRKCRGDDRDRRSGARGDRCLRTTATVWLAAANAELARGNVDAAGAICWPPPSDPVDDSRASANYRRRIIPRMLARAFAEASAQVRAS